LLTRQQIYRTFFYRTKKFPEGTTMEASARKRSRRTQEERREEAERRLLEAAVRIIAKSGVETFTLADVGEAAGYSRGLPAHYFQTKSGLLAAVIGYLVDHYFRRATFQGRQRITIDDIVAEVSSFMEVAKKNPLAAKAFMAAMAGAVTNPTLAEVAQNHNADVIAKYEEGILNGIKHGEIDSGIRAHSWAIMLVAATRGIVAQWLIHPKKVNLDLLREDLDQVIRHCFAPR
jgi:AcrR family transcriptional regulator